METITTNWTHEELHAYLLIYCSNADYKETAAELEFINKKLKDGFFNKMHEEFRGDNDYTSIQKIQNTIERLGYTEKQIDDFIKEIRDLFLADGKYDILERNLMLGLNRVL